jgi:hypothetical protein
VDPPVAIFATVTSAVLDHALTDPGDPPLRPLPADALRLLRLLGAPPRLGAHLRAVHDVAYQLTGLLSRDHPRLAFDREAVLFGAATHDIGKVIHVEELSGPGSAHEPAGRALLLANGVPAGLARFAGTHGSWTGPDITIEDLLVTLADKVWKAKRVPDLEELVVDRLAAATRVERWEAFLSLDDILDRLATDADRRLAYQAGYPITVAG